MIQLGMCTQRRLRNVIKNANCEMLSAQQDMLEAAAASSHKVALLLGEEPLGFIITEPCPQVPQMGHTWAVLTSRAKGHGVGLVRAARRYIKDNFSDSGYELLYTFCRADEPDQQRWVTALGFNRAPQGDHETDGINWMGYTYHE